MSPRSIFLRCAGALLAVLVVLACGDAPDGAVSADAGEAADRELAPQFTFNDLEGRTVSLAGLRGQTVIIDFWATWCPPCVFQPRS